MEHLERGEPESEMKEDEPGPSTSRAEHAGEESHGYRDVTMEDPEIYPEDLARYRRSCLGAKQHDDREEVPRNCAKGMAFHSDLVDSSALRFEL